MTKVELATKVAFSHLGTFYSWGGDDPSGFDCSGFVIEILKSVGLLRRRFDTTSRGLFKIFENNLITEPREGCLVFYVNINEKIVHVEYCLDDTFKIGATGGGSDIKDKEDAILANAFIKVRPIESDRRLKIFVDPFGMSRQDDIA
jgi:D-gamma-glutamyl-meso-diaminopimelic acid endopeptidase CwlS|tara:strand:+ start:2255 stop:2692 length:438 start_codon:yes stop_codon:yes gene_type:complete